MLGFQLIQDAGQPGRRVFAGRLSGARGEREDFRKKAFHGEIIQGRGGLHFAKEFHAQPKQRSAADILARCIQNR